MKVKLISIYYKLGRVDNFSFFDCSSPFCFLLIGFQCTFLNFIKEYNIMCIIIVFLIRYSDCPAAFFRTSFTSFHTHASLLTVFVCFDILFHSCYSFSRVFVKTLVHEFYISNGHREWYLLFRETWSVWSKSHLSKTNYNNDILYIIHSFS